MKVEIPRSTHSQAAQENRPLQPSSNVFMGVSSGCLADGRPTLAVHAPAPANPARRRPFHYPYPTCATKVRNDGSSPSVAINVGLWPAEATQ